VNDLPKITFIHGLHELSRIKKYIIKIRENQLYPRNPCPPAGVARSINIVASLRYFFPQRVKILLK
jgi:hypothetical protein